MKNFDLTSKIIKLNDEITALYGIKYSLRQNNISGKAKEGGKELGKIQIGFRVNPETMAINFINSNTNISYFDPIILST